MKFLLFTNTWTGECSIVCSQDYPIITYTYPFSIQFLHQIADSFELIITQFIEYSWNGIFSETDTLHVISKWSRNNEHLFLKVSPPELAVASWLPLHYFLSANRPNESCFGEKNAYSIHWQTHLHNYMLHNKPFYTFNKDNIEHVTPVKQGHGECLASIFVKYHITFRRCFSSCYRFVLRRILYNYNFILITSFRRYLLR